MSVTSTARRRVGKKDSATRVTILDAAARIMIGDGYAAVTYRSVAARADVTASLVQYYFPTLDDLFIALVHQLTERTLAGLDAATAARHPLRAIWSQASDPKAAALVMEFSALANHRPAVRQPMGAVGEQIRVRQAEVLRRHWEANPRAAGPLPPAALIFTLTAIPRMAVLEGSYGLDTGHTDTIAAVEALLEELEPLDEDNA